MRKEPVSEIDGWYRRRLFWDHNHRVIVTLFVCFVWVCDSRAEETAAAGEPRAGLQESDTESFDRPVVSSQTGDDFWTQIAISRTPDSYLQSVQEAISKQQWGYAESLCAQLIQEYPGLPLSQRHAAYKFRLLSLIHQIPLPNARVERVFEQLAAERAFRDETLWNLAVRLLLRQVAVAENVEEGAGVWVSGLARLSPDAKGHGLRSGTLIDLDRFLNLPSVASMTLDTPRQSTGQGLDPVFAVDALMQLGLDITALRELNRRRIILLRDMNLTDQMLDAAWRQFVLNASPDGNPVDALEMLVELNRSAGFPRIEQGLIEPKVSGDAVWEKPSSRPVDDTMPVDASIGSLHHQITLSILYGSPSNGLVAGQRALAIASTADVGRVFSALAIVAVSGTRDLRMASEPLRWHLRRLTQGLPASPDDKDLSERLGITWARATASVDTGPTDTRHAFMAQSDYVQQLMLRNELKRRSDASARWAEDALNRGRLEISALFWGQALIDASLADDPADPGSDYLRGAVDGLAAVLRRHNDRDSAVEMIGRVDRELGNSRAREPLLFLGVTLLYEQGRMADCLLAMDRVESLDPQWDKSKQLAAGLIRAVALIKLGRLEDAESVLSELSTFNGENEVMAQVTFLRGWILLNQNKTRLALDRFRGLVETYPSTSYADKTREMIHRLERSSVVGQ
ncbi:MAG: hypothetical protein AAF333_02500 [Planctomycetota bacterium]